MKNLLKLILLSVITIASSSCSKNEETVIEPAPTIVGKWEFSKQVTYDNSNQEVITDYTHSCPSQKNFIQFESNGVYNSTGSSSNCISETETRTYVYENNVVNLYNGSNLLSYKIRVLSLTANEIKIRRENSTIQKAGIVDTYILVRK